MNGIYNLYIPICGLLLSIILTAHFSWDSISIALITKPNAPYPIISIG